MIFTPCCLVGVKMVKLKEMKLEIIMPQNEYLKILSVRADRIAAEEIISKIEIFLSSNNQHYLVTLNPEMAVEAREDSYFQNIINQADLVIPDGMGIILAGKIINRKIPLEKISGIGLIYKICEAEFVKCKKIYLLGGRNQVAKKAAEKLKQKYSCLNIVGAEKGIEIPNKFPSLKKGVRGISERGVEYEKLNQQLIQRINEAKPDILFVAFGAPKQEKWIAENLKKMPSVKLAMGVGGSFDFISGKIKRAPLVFRKLGLEWLWRLILEPRRIKRIYTATAKFSWLVLKSLY